MTIKLYDFRKPDRPLGTLEQRVAGWLRAACRLAAGRSEQQLPFRLEVSLRGVERLAPDEALARLPETAVGFRTAFDGESTALLAWPRPFALALVAGALGEEPDELPEDRELTVVEHALCEYLVQGLFAPAVQETWPAASPLAVTVRERELAPRWTRLFVRAEHVLAATFTTSGPFGTQEWHWLLAARDVLDRLTRAGQVVEPSPEQSAARRLEAVVRELPVEVVVDLGTVELPISQLANLAAGDLLILDRRLTEPLAARVDGQKKFLGWPGRVGARQGLLIESLIG